MVWELREFVYLDSMSVNSLLASQYMAVPETVREISEDIEEDTDEKGVGGSIGHKGIAELWGEWTKGDTEQSRRMAETERRINDQYRFSILHRTLGEANQLEELNEAEADDEESFSLGQGDVVKATGVCVTDPFYRLLNSVSSIMRIAQIDELEGQDTEDFEEMMGNDGEWMFDIMKDILHGERIGLKIDPVSYSYPILMSVGTEDLWVTPEREFVGNREYTVVGRVSQVLTGQKKWDFIDLLKLMGGVFSEDSVDDLRDALLEVADDLERENESGDGFQFGLEIDRDDYVVNEPSIVIDPIAIYW